MNRRSYSTRLTKVQRGSFSVTPNLHEIIIGTGIGDTFVCKSASVNFARLQFAQSIIHEAYILHLYELFKDFCNSSPKYLDLKSDKRTGKVYSRIRFRTYSLPCFNYYHELFYVNGIKIIPLNIGELLTPVGLAYWAMDDGYKGSSGFTFCTDSYTLSEVQLLVKVLKENFDLNSTIHNKSKDSYRIYIKADSMDKLRILVTPYFHESMMYKIGV